MDSGFSPREPRRGIPTSRAATMACRTAPESPLRNEMTSLEKLVPPAGLA